MGLVYVEMPRLASAFKINHLQRVVKTAMKTTLLFKMAVFLLSFCCHFLYVAELRH